MTLEEILEAAENGDISAINAVGDVYSRDMHISDAAMWYGRSAALGDQYGRVMALMSHQLWASVGEGTGVYDDALDNWQMAYKYLTDILNDVNSLDEHTRTAKESYSGVVLGIGASLYFLKRKEESFKYLEIAAEQGEIMAEVMLGLYFQSTFTAETGYEYTKRSIPLLEKVFSPDFAYSDSSHMEQMIVFLAYRYLAETYRRGLGGLKPDTARSYNCMLCLHEQNLKNYTDEVRKELGKYKKGLLGGYKYIG